MTFKGKGVCSVGQQNPAYSVVAICTIPIFLSQNFHYVIVKTGAVRERNDVIRIVIYGDIA